jgi:hypothetical protein
MPIFRHDSDERDQDIIEWTAGGESDVALLIGGRTIGRETVPKGQRVRIVFNADHEEDDDP